jgi:hypothetical protein
MIGCACSCHRRMNPVRATALAMLMAAIAAGPACAQSGAPIKIGYSMSLIGGLAPNGKSALLAQRIWEEDTNAKGGMLGRPVKLIYYDDKSSPSEIPPIYTKLLDVDKVDLIIGAYGTALTAPAMPIVIQRKKTFMGLLALAVNSQFNYPNYFVMIPSGPEAKPAFTKGFFDLAVRQDPKPQTVAIVAADQEFSRNAADGARENTKQSGLKLVYERTYPPATTDFAPIVRAIAADQVLQQAVEGTKTLDDAKLGDYIRAHPFTTVVGDVRFGAEGEWAQSRFLQVQYQNIQGHDIAQFKDMSTQVVVAPPQYASGQVIYPYERAK